MKKKKKRVKRTVKSTVFIMLFEDKERLLELYNAVSGKHYEDPDLLKITTLKNAIYMSIQNDVSFLIDGRMSLYEHQSTYSPNLPLRFLFYVSDLYSGLTSQKNLYGTKAVQIPTPEFIIFYNGAKQMPEQQILKLSDLYSVKEKDYKLELKVRLLNICGDYNRELKGLCSTLKEYAIYTDKIRAYSRKMDIQSAVERAVDECIREGVLRDFLMKHKAEAIKVSIYEYDRKRHIRMEKEESWAEGHEAGLKQGHEAGLKQGHEEGLRKGLREGRSEMAGKLNRLTLHLLEQKRYEDIKQAAEDDGYCTKLMEEFGIGR